MVCVDLQERSLHRLDDSATNRAARHFDRLTQSGSKLTNHRATVPTDEHQPTGSQTSQEKDKDGSEHALIMLGRVTYRRNRVTPTDQLPERVNVRWVTPDGDGVISMS